MIRLKDGLTFEDLSVPERVYEGTVTTLFGTEDGDRLMINDVSFLESKLSDFQ